MKLKHGNLAIGGQTSPDPSLTVLSIVLKFLPIVVALPLVLGCISSGRFFNSNNIHRVDFGVSTSADAARLFGPPFEVRTNLHGTEWIWQYTKTGREFRGPVILVGLPEPSDTKLFYRPHPRPDSVAVMVFEERMTIYFDTKGIMVSAACKKQTYPFDKKDRAYRKQVNSQ